MALINIQQREIHCKLVYYGPPMAGKTSCLQYLLAQTPSERRGELRAIATKRERILSLDLLDPDDAVVGGDRVRLYLYTVSGNTLYESTRAEVLEGADGVIFVADSRKRLLEENIRSLKELARKLTRLRKKIHEFPMVLQYNKRDVADALPLVVMDKYLNPLGWQRFESVSPYGIGVFEAFDALRKLVVAKL